ncbi:MAG: hypothetical protein ACTHK8_02010 [Ginsengibacter sp.]
MNSKFTSPYFSKVFKRCLGILALLLTLFLQNNLFAQTAPVTPPSGGFSINGQLRVNSNVGDWFPGTGTGGHVFNENGTPLDSTTTGKQVDNYSTNDNIFTNGSKFNDYVANLHWFSNSAPDKNDINVALYHVSRDSSNNQWIFISGDRLSTNGTSYIDFELLQGSITQNSDGTFTGTPAPNKNSGGGRTENDIIISMEYTNGGSKPNVYIYQWKKSGNTWSYQQVTPTDTLASNAFAETNRTGDLTNLPYTAFGKTTYPQYAFVEAGVNITYLLNLSGLACASIDIHTLWVKTKASASSTAALKDFIQPIPVDLKFGSSSIKNPGPFCSDDDSVYTLKATPAGGTFIVDGVTATTFTPSTAGTGKHPVSYSYSGCSASDTLVVYPKPTADAGGPYVICASDDSVVVSGTYGGGATGGSWTTSGSGTFSNKSTNTGTKTVKATYTPSSADVTAGKVILTFTSSGQATVCSAASDTSSLTIKPTPAAPKVTAQNNCDGTSVLTASNYTGTLLWSTGSTTDTIHVTNNNTYTVVQTVKGCASPSGSGNATIKTTPAAPTVTAQNNCDGTSILTASNYTGSLLWSTGSTTDTIHVNNNNTYTVVQTVNGCTSDPGSGNATIKSTPAAPSVSMLSVTCTDKTFSVQVNSPVAGTIYTLTQPGNADPSSTTQTINYTSGDAIFSGLTFGDGYSVTSTNSDGCISDPNSCGEPAPEARLAAPVSIQNQPITLDKPVTDVKAVPNPYNNVIRFTLQSDVSGHGTLELYNLLGQKVKTVYQGYIQKGFKQNIDYTVPGGAHTNLIYLFRVGNERKSGILIGAK